MLLILASLILLIIGFFSPTTSLFWYKQERTKKTSAIIYGLTFIASFILFGITTDKNRNSHLSTSNSLSGKQTIEETQQQSTQDAVQRPVEQPREKQWTNVYTFKGNGMKKSPVFQLTGGEARLKYSYKAPGGIGMGMFSVYVVDEGNDIMKTGGFPEVMTQAENEESESTIQKGEGRYYLNVSASGNWVVTVEEMK